MSQCWGYTHNNHIATAQYTFLPYGSLRTRAFIYILYIIGLSDVSEKSDTA